MDALERIDEIVATVENARAVPMSRNCLIERQEMINALEELRQELPGELRRAANLLEERDKILDAGKREADRIIAEGEQEHTRLVSVHEVVVSAEHEASRIISEAREEAQRLRDEVDDYVDTALANFEQFLTRALASIERGRDKMYALREIGGFNSDEESDSGSGGEREPEHGRGAAREYGADPEYGADREYGAGREYDTERQSY